MRRLNEELEETNRGVLALYTELSQELEETNSGVVALHAELEEKSARLRETNEAKTRFWRNISHELRTPVNAVVALTRLLMAPGSAPLTDEQRRQLSSSTPPGSPCSRWSAICWTWRRRRRASWRSPRRRPICGRCWPSWVP